MTQPLASLSLDLDNKWSYMKTHGDVGWEAYPSYLDVVVPRVLAILAERQLTITFFVVGQDAALDKNRAALASLADADHEIGNHSFKHEPWLHLYSPEEIAAELAAAEEAIREATGRQPTGFRGPGFSLSPQVLAELARRGYHYDCSTFPTFLGPLARLYYFATAGLNRKQKADRKQLFGKMSEGFRPLRPYAWRDAPPLVEIPVTTMPIFRVPIHVSYLLYLGRYSKTLASAYFAAALTLCRLLGVEPSILLHPLDFLGCEDERDLSFFPAMNLPAERKLAIVGRALDQLQSRFRVITMAEHAAAVRERLAPASSAPSRTAPGSPLPAGSRA